MHKRMLHVTARHLMDVGHGPCPGQKLPRSPIMEPMTAARLTAGIITGNAIWPMPGAGLPSTPVKTDLVGPASMVAPKQTSR
eukprot:5280887-Pyramimonas_sp.AAC.1